MKLAFLTLALLLSGQLLYGQQNYFTIEGKLAKKTDYKYIYLNYESTEAFKQDSSLIKNGAFYFKGVPVYGTHASIQLKNTGTADPDDGNQFDFMIGPPILKFMWMEILMSPVLMDRRTIMISKKSNVF